MRMVPEFPALAGGFFATEPPGKPPCIFFEKIFFSEGPCSCQGVVWRVAWCGTWCGCLGTVCIPGMLGPSGSSHTWPSPVWEKRGSRDGTYFRSMGRVQVELQKKVLPNDNDTFVFLDHLWFHFLFILFFKTFLVGNFRGLEDNQLPLALLASHLAASSSWAVARHLLVEEEPIPEPSSSCCITGA